MKRKRNANEKLDGNSKKIRNVIRKLLVDESKKKIESKQMKAKQTRNM